MSDLSEETIFILWSILHVHVGAGLQDFDTNRLYERVKVMIEGLTLER